jgi:predicted MFS family arabinose efflux permease
MDTTLELYAWHGAMGLLGVGAIMAPLNSLAGQWLVRDPGLAIGVVSAGGALGQGVLPFLARQLVVTEGWSRAYLLLGVAYLVVMVPLALFLRNPPPAVQATGPVVPAGQTRPRAELLGWLCVAVVFCCICMATPIVHVAALGADRGLGPSTSAGLLATMMVFGMAGRIGFGRLADRVGNLPAYMAASAGQTALAFLFPWAPGTVGLFVLSALFGLVFSGAMTAFILCAREWSPPGRTGLSIGIVMLFGWIGMAAGGWQGGAFHDLCGSYVPAFANASIGGVLNLVVLGWLYHLTRGPGPRVRKAVA